MIKKNVIKKLILVVTILMLGLKLNIYASTISVSQSSTLTVGATKSISITGSDVTGKFNISISNSNVSSTTTSVWVENNTVAFNITAEKAGIANITISPASNNVSNSLGKDISSDIKAKDITITVKAKADAAPTKPETTIKDTNANLKKLVPNYEGLTPNFNPDITKYSLTVPATATSVKFTVQVAGVGAKYWITGDDNLKLGDNIVTITVTAQSGAKKTYTILVTKANNIATANAYLSSIVIDGKTLSPNFTSEVLEYDIGEVSSDINKINVLAYAQSEKATVKIIGNDSLVEGENKILVQVTAEDGTTTKEYTIKVLKPVAVKPLEEENKMVNIYEEDNDSKSNSAAKTIISDFFRYIRKNLFVLSLITICIVEFWIIIYLIIKLKKTGTKEIASLDDKNTKVFNKNDLNNLKTEEVKDELTSKRRNTFKPETEIQEEKTDEDN